MPLVVLPVVPTVSRQRSDTMYTCVPVTLIQGPAGTLATSLVKIIAKRFSGRPRGGQGSRQVGAMNCNGLLSP